MSKRTQEQIDAQISGLMNERNSLPERNMFGGNNWEPIDAQIAVLKGEKEPDDFYQDESSEEFEDGDNDVYSAAMQAEDWLEGRSDDNLFSTGE